MQKVKVTCNIQEDVAQDGRKVNQSMPLVDFELYCQNGYVFDEKGLNDIKERIREMAMTVTPGGTGVNAILEIEEI